MPFNPLFEIPMSQADMYGANYFEHLSILFLRFRGAPRLGGVAQDAVQYLSILFLRFGAHVPRPAQRRRVLLSILFLRFPSLFGK